MKSSESQISESGASSPLCLSDPLSSVSGTTEEQVPMSKEASLSDFDLLNNMDTDSDLEHEGIHNDINEGVVLYKLSIMLYCHCRYCQACRNWTVSTVDCVCWCYFV